MTPTTRALVAAARAGLQPDPGAAARVRARLDLALAAPAPAAAVSSGLAAKLAIALAIAAGAGALVIPSHGATTTAVPAPTFQDVVVETSPPHVASASTEPAAPAVVPAAHHARTDVVVAPADESREVNLAREVALIDRAMAALRTGDADQARAAIATYHRETADRGQLVEEASAIDIEASCILHLDVADKLGAFDRAWPSSAQRKRLTAVCSQ